MSALEPQVACWQVTHPTGAKDWFAATAVGERFARHSAEVSGGVVVPLYGPEVAAFAVAVEELAHEWAADANDPSFSDSYRRHMRIRAADLRALLDTTHPDGSPE